eukprot:m.299096 g.299096  ORF g.299096 m.299096 type:complete len:451 (-) comp20103_c0_seq1:333-1685(-)
MTWIRSSSFFAAAVLVIVVNGAKPIKAHWGVHTGRLTLQGSPVVLHGIGTTCTEYLLRGIGMACWGINNFKDFRNVITSTNDEQINAITQQLLKAKNSAVHPIVRIPMTASYWLNITTDASKANMEKYPELSGQYQTLIKKLVHNYTSAGVTVLLDLHWNDDDTEQQPMALKSPRSDGSPTGDALEFWDSIAQTFGSNALVFYELYNEPHLSSTSEDTETWMNGNTQYAGMLEMLAMVRKHAPTSMVVVAGATSFAYDSTSLLVLDDKLQSMGETHVLFNFHPYMGPNQAGDSTKCPMGFEAHLQKLTSTGRPTIVTEFGQACCSTNGACESCPGAYNGTAMGYDEQIAVIARAYGASWLPWSWRPAAAGAGNACMDLNGGNANGTALVHPTDGKGADWATLWEKYGPHGSEPVPSGCPGGSMSACMQQCPASPPPAYRACVASCADHCP